MIWASRGGRLAHRYEHFSQPLTSVPHAGFEMGVERMTGWLRGIHHIREIAPFPRLMERLEP